MSRTFTKRKPAAEVGGQQSELPLSMTDAPRAPALSLAVLTRHPRAGRAWTPAETGTLRIDLPRLGLERVAHVLMRPAEEVRAKAVELGIEDSPEDRRLRRKLAVAGVPVEPSTTKPRRGRASTWSKEEDAAILARYATEGALALSADPIFDRRSYRAIEQRANRLNVQVSPEAKRAHQVGRKTPRWTPAEDALIDAAASLDDLPALLLQLPGRTLRAVELRYNSRRENKRTYRPWSSEDDARLIELYPQLPAEDIAKLMDRTYAAVTNRATHLKITAKYQAWSPVDDAVLLKNFHDTPLDLLAKRLKRTALACQVRAARIGLIAHSDASQAVFDSTAMPNVRNARRRRKAPA